MALSKLTDLRKSLSAEVNNLKVSGITTFTGNVSIGGTLTYEDVTNIDSVGVVTARQGIFIDDSITHIGDTNTKIRFPSNDTITFETSGSERLRIDNNGKVLIATDTTSEAGANGDELIIGKTTDDANHGLTIVTPSNRYGTVAFSDGSGGTNRGLLEYNHSTDFFRIYVAASERLRIDSSGRVIIGTTAASTLTSSDDLTISTSGSTGITLFSATGNAGNIAFGDGTSGDDRNRGLLQYHHSDNTMRFFTDAVRRMTITSGGTGIGTDAPANVLDVQGSTHAKIHVGTTGTGHATGIQINHAKGNAALQEWQLQTDGSADGNLKIRNATSSTDVMFFDADNINVGLNETSPDNKLHITTTDGTDYSTSTTNTTNGTNALLKLVNLSGSDGGGVNNYVGIQFAVASGATSSAQFQYVRTGNNAGAFHFKARNAASTYPNLMQISSDGSVNKPKNPAFYAYLTANNAVYSAGTVIPWDGTDIDTRSGFQTSGSDQGRYIIPTDGIYFFGWRLNRLGDSRFDIGIFKNGSVQYYDELRQAGTAGIWQTEASHYLMSCSAGQKVDLRITSVYNSGSAMFDGGGNGYYDGFFGWMVG